MVDLNIRIRIEVVHAQKALRDVDRSINQTITNAERLRRALLGALQLFGLATVIRQLLQFADTAQLVENRIRLVTKSQAELVAVTEELFAVSNRTRSNYELTAQIFTRVAAASKTLGVNQRQLLQFTESVNQAVAISGATFEEANNALIQFSQGIARGQLRGDELRSVLEQLPAVADVIAERFGVSRGQIILFAEQGKITAEAILEAFAAAREELAEKFGRTIPTIAQAMENLRTNFVQVADEFNKATGIVGKLSGLILALAKNAELLARTLVFLTSVIVTLLVNKGIALATRALLGFFVAMATNPIGATIFAIVTLTSAIISFGDKVKLGAGNLGTLQDVAVVVFEDLTDLVVDLASTTAKLFNEENFDTAITALGVVIANGFIGIFEKIIDLASAFEAAMVQAFKNIGSKVTGQLDKVLGDIGTKGRALLGLEVVDTSGLKKFEEAPKRVKDAFLDAAELLGKTDFLPRIPTPPEAEKLGKDFAAAFGKGFNLDDTLARANQRAVERNRATETERAISIGLIEDPLDTIRAIEGVTTASLKLDEAIQKLNRTRDFENQLLGASSRERDVANQVRKIEEELIKDGLRLSEDERERLRLTIAQTEAYKAQGDILQNAIGAQQDYATAVRDVVELLARQEETQKALALGLAEDPSEQFEKTSLSIHDAADELLNLKIQALEASNALGDGLERGFLKAIVAARDLASVAEDLVVNAFSKLEETIGSVFTSLATSLFTSKANFSDFIKSLRGLFSELVDSILADLTKLLARQALLALLNSFTGGSAGILASLTAAADGASNTRPGQPFLVGEEGPELFVPRQRGEIVPHGPSMAAIGAAQGGTTIMPVPAPEVRVTVVNVSDPKDAIAALDSDEGGKVILNRLGKQRNAARRMLS